MENFEKRFNPFEKGRGGEDREGIIEEREQSIGEKGQEINFESEAHVEERPSWGEFRGGEINEIGGYKEPTPEQKEKFEKRIERISDIFEDADFQWYLDGATNISLYEGKQIRDHKDLDISIFREDSVKLNELLARQGFGIFINYNENGKRLMRKVTTEELATLEKPDLSICKIDSDGKIQKETEESFNFVDLHIHSKDTEGNTVISYNDAVLPKKFFEPVRKELPNGKEINLSQPAIVAYHKLHSDRPYDLIDLEKIRPHLQEEDFSMIRESLKIEAEEAEKTVREKVREAWDFLAPMLELPHDHKIISEKLWEHPDLQKRRNDQRISEFISSISKYVSENPEITFDDFLSQSLAILKPQEQAEQRLETMERLEKIEKA